MVGCRYLVARFRLFPCLLYARKKEKFFLKLESNSLAVHNILEPGANKMGDVFVGTQIITQVVFC